MLAFLITYQWNTLIANPLIVDTTMDVNKFNEKSTISAKLPTQYNVMESDNDDRAPTTFHPMDNIQTFKITHDDVVTGNSVYGSSQSSGSQFSNGGILFAISGQQASGANTPMISEGLIFSDLISIIH
jgi:hypothetical protein